MIRKIFDAITHFYIDLWNYIGVLTKMLLGFTLLVIAVGGPIVFSVIFSWWFLFLYALSPIIFIAGADMMIDACTD